MDGGETPATTLQNVGVRLNDGSETGHEEGKVRNDAIHLIQVSRQIDTMSSPSEDVEVRGEENIVTLEDDTEASHDVYVHVDETPAPLAVRKQEVNQSEEIASGAVTGMFRDGYEEQPTDVFIAVMGVTGAGKSTFISLCTEKELQIGHSLQGCTKTVSVYLCKYRPDLNVYLIDTPGFDDTNLSDTEVLKEIAAWLTASYSFSIKLHGIIYLHRITDVRMQGSAKRNLFLFKKLCGTEALRNVLLATTMWEKVDEKTGLIREEELVATPEFWGLMKDKGSRIVRHHNDLESAMRLLHILVSQPPAEATIVLDVQSQMVDGGKTLGETDAGQEIALTLTGERTKHEEELLQTRADKQEALNVEDQESAALLTEHEQETDERIRQLKAEQEELKITMERLHQEKLAELTNEVERIRNENRQAYLALEQTRQQQEEERAMFEQQRATSLNVERTLSRNLEDTQLQLTQLTKDSSGSPRPDGPDTSVALFGVYYVWVASTNTRLRPPPKFPSAKQIPNNRARYVAIGDQGSYYIHYHTIDDRCCTLLSKNFSRIYPTAHRHIIDNKQFGCPTCVSLGMHGNCFIRTEGGVFHNLRRSTTAKLKDMGSIESMWLGADGAYVAVRRDGSATWDLKGDYVDLQICLQLVCHAPGLDGSAIKALAMNPHDHKQWIAIFQDGRTSFNEGKAYTFEGSEYTKWCGENFGTMKLVVKNGSEDDIDKPSSTLVGSRPELESEPLESELDAVRKVAELEDTAPPLPPRGQQEPVELEDLGGPKELPASTPTASEDKSSPMLRSKPSSSLKSRLSKLKIHRRPTSPSSRTEPAELKG